MNFRWLRLCAAAALAAFAASGQTLSIVTASALPDARVGQNYSVLLSATGGTPPYRWSTGAGLPDELRLNADTGAIAGVPAAAGTISFTAQVTDAARSTTAKTFFLVIAPAALSITTPSPLFNGTVGVPYAQTLSASGGSPPYRWTVASGITGDLTLDAVTGVLQGTPKIAGTFSFMLQVTDTAGARATQIYSVVITPPSVSIALTALPPAGVVGVRYEQRLLASATGGTSPFTWSLTGSIPGVDFDSSSLTLAGVPSQAGSFSLTLQVRDSAGQTASKTFSVTIAPAALTIATARQLAAATLNAAFSQPLEASGGAPPYTWSATGLPAGLTIQSGTGVVSGTPTVAGKFSPVVITVTDSSLNRYSDNFSISVSLPALPAVTVSGLPATVDPAKQYTIEISLASPYAAPLTGQAILTFSPESGLGDNTIQFASGGASAPFTIPAGAQKAVSAVPLALQTGTVSGTIGVTLRLQAGGVDITPSTPPLASAQIARSTPVIAGVQVSRTSNTIQIAVTGYSTAREVTEAVFNFAAAAGQSLQPASASITVDVSGLFAGWFSSSPQGSLFLFTQPFTVQGDPAAVVPVSVTLKNRIGSVTTEVKVP